MTFSADNIRPPIIIGITGGMGAGKSVVSRVLRLRGYDVYDCDSEAKRLMMESESIKKSVANVFGQKAIGADGQLDRYFLAERIFRDPMSRHMLESIVHPAVRSDIERWAGEYHAYKHVFLESAILVSSGIAECCSAIILVEADRDERIRRVRFRNNWREEDIVRRIEAQKKETDMLSESERPVYRIDNTGTESVLDQIDIFLKMCKHSSGGRTHHADTGPNR